MLATCGSQPIESDYLESVWRHHPFQPIRSKRHTFCFLSVQGVEVVWNSRGFFLLTTLTAFVRRFPSVIDCFVASRCKTYYIVIFYFSLRLSVSFIYLSDWPFIYFDLSLFVKYIAPMFFLVIYIWHVGYQILQIWCGLLTCHEGSGARGREPRGDDGSGQVPTHLRYLGQGTANSLHFCNCINNVVHCVHMSVCPSVRKYSLAAFVILCHLWLLMHHA